MSGEYLLDANIVAAILNSDPSLTKHRGAGTRLLVPSIVVGELCYGAANSRRPVENLAKIESFVTSAIVVPVELETARRYGEVRLNLKRKGRPIPENDIWIAALALQYGLPLVTRDAHFTEVDGLTVIGW